MKNIKHIKKLRTMLEQGDVIIQEGSNKLGSFIKCSNGKLLMICINGGFPVQPVNVPEILEPNTNIITERWK